MFGHTQPKDGVPKRKSGPATSTLMDNDQFANYLRSLREQRVTRPIASPEPPTHARSTAPRASLSGGASPAVNFSEQTTSVKPEYAPTPSAIAQANGLPEPPRNFSARPSLNGSISSRYSVDSTHGRDYYPERKLRPLKPGQVVATDTYMERGQRWMEKEEAVALRDALNAKDAKTRTETRVEDSLQQAALQEAAELVYQHQHGIKPPEPGTPYRYRQHLRKDSYAHARTASVGLYGDEIQPTGLARDWGSRSVSGSSSSSHGSASRRDASFETAPETRTSLDRRPGEISTGRPSKRVSAPPSTHVYNNRRRSSGKRNISGEPRNSFTQDQIWEEPEEATPLRPTTSHQHTQPMALRAKPKNPLNHVAFEPAPVSKVQEFPPRLYRQEIHRNPPSQSRNAAYTENHAETMPRQQDVPVKDGIEIRGDDIRHATSRQSRERSPNLPTPTGVSDRLGRPIVSFDTNWKTPDEATDQQPDRRRSVAAPGVLQGKQWQQQQSEEQPEQHFSTRSQASQIPTINVEEVHVALPAASSQSVAIPSIHIDGPSSETSETRRPPIIPIISVTEVHAPRLAASSRSDQLPTFQVDGPADEVDTAPPIPTTTVKKTGPSVPAITLSDKHSAQVNIPVIITQDAVPSSSSARGARPLPTPRNTPGHHTQPQRHSRSHWSPDPTNPPLNNSRATARCHECNHPIEGRFVSLAGTSARFHPHCFSCHTCGTSLEALEISPEPPTFRTARLLRIQQRAQGESLPEFPGQTLAEDGTDPYRLRFFCHLDWHEQFAPKCKHCRTPILDDEHIVALGGQHFHYGHFFCAECGDPFERGMTHIEKDGYAWCVACQTQRTERRASKCRACKRAVVGEYVQALGGDWHEECFRCASCGGGFGDGQVFPRDGAVVCTGCRERELKM